MSLSHYPPNLAARAGRLTGSVIDASMSLLQDQSHDVVRFAMGSPAPSAIPGSAFAEILAALGDAPDAFDYAPSEGDAALRAALLEYLGRAGGAPDPEELLITAGGMQGLDLTCKLFVERGDLVLVEGPTYTNGAATIASYEGRMIEVPVDREGLVVSDLERAVADAGAAPKLIYVIPNFQNPSGETLSLRRREELLALAAGWGAVILEDDPYGWLHFGDDPLPGLRELSGNAPNVVSVHTLSKVLAPGLRLGWVVADPSIVSLMVDAKQGMDTCANVPLQRLTARFFSEGRMDEHLAELRATYAANKEAMKAALARTLGDLDIQWTDPDGGFFLWLTLPDELDADELFPVALEEGVAYIPGSAFSVAGRFRNALRLCYASNTGERIDLGVARLRRAVDRQLAGAGAASPPPAASR
jgi:2-aminoadipate transaminase